MKSENQYFAILSPKDLAAHVIKLKDNYYEYLESSGHLELLRTSFYTYFKPGLRFGKLLKSGKNNEYIEHVSNHFRNLIQHSLSLVCGQRPHFEPKATNTDYKSQLQTQLANGLLEYYNRMKKMERFIKAATESALIYGEGFVYVGWNPTLGATIGNHPDTGAPLYEGDVEFKNLHTLDIIRDIHKNENQVHNWVIVRNIRNKYDLAAKFPELSDRILSVKNDKDLQYRIDLQDRQLSRDLMQSDDIFVYSFIHRQTEALPSGRYCELIDSDIVLFDGPLPYRELPIYRVAPGERTGSFLGYTNAFDLLPLQDALDKLYSTVVTNQAAFGVQNIAVPKGNDLNVAQLSGGLNIIEYDAKAGPPVPLQLTQSPPETFTMIELIKSDMETIFGIASVVRGNPEESLKSGSALALVQSTSIQFSQNLQQSYVQLLEDVGTAVINLLRDYASTKRVALIAGKSNRAAMKEFKGDDLSLINRVVVDMGNPLSRTTAGRVNIAEQLIQLGMIKNPQQYLEVLTTGRIEPIYESEVASLNLIRSENEKLSDGVPVIVLATDDHQNHIAEHLSILASPEIRERPEIVEVVLAHVQQHQLFLMPQMPQASQQAPAESESISDASGNIPDSIAATNPVTEEAAQVNLPNMPTNPLTGEEAPQPNTGVI